MDIDTRFICTFVGSYLTMLFQDYMKDYNCDYNSILTLLYDNIIVIVREIIVYVTHKKNIVLIILIINIFFYKTRNIEKCKG